MLKRSLLKITRVVLVFIFIFASPKIATVQATSTKTIPGIDLNVSINDITRVEFGMHVSSFESQDTDYTLDVKYGQLTNGKIFAPVSILKSLISGLRGMYPGTRSLIWQRWTDDYPHAWVYLHLKDGRIIEISSDSQFDGMFPWNVSMWATEKATLPDAMYIQLQPALLEGIDDLWKGIGEKGFPRKHYDPKLWNSMSGIGDPALDTSKFYPYEQYTANEDASATIQVWGMKTGALNAFVPLLQRNPEINTLLDAGYTLYDAAFTLEVKSNSLEPVEYSGTLALAAPGGQDAVVGLATIPFDSGQPVTTTLKASEVMQRVEQRKASAFLNQAAQIFSPLTFLLDTRDGVRSTDLNCPEDAAVALNGHEMDGIRNTENPQRIQFFPLSDQRWTFNFQTQRSDPGWSDDLAQSVLKTWFPPAFSNLPIQDIKGIATGADTNSGWMIAFQPGVSLRDPELLNQLKTQLPTQTVVHMQNPEKDGDFSFLSLDGRAIVSETGSAPAVVNCGRIIPSWYGKPYPIEDVTPPNDQAPRMDMRGVKGVNGNWRPLLGPLPSGDRSAEWSAIAFSKPGFLHVIWSVQDKGVYYADGWIDGTGWTQPQRLGDNGTSVAIYAWPDGEVHLFWDAGLNSGGTIHVWRPAGGTWQKAEHWPDIGFFSEVLRDSSGTLHLGYVGSDGLDKEFMHQTWSPVNGLSAPENISRYLGDIGNATTVLRFDSQGQLHAAWSHVLEQKSVPDPLTGETSDVSGVFYAYRLPDGHWSKPEQIGVLATYAHALSMELDAHDQPLIVWQSEDGLVSRIRKNNAWLPAISLAKVNPPKTPAEFGPDRQVKPSADIQTGVNGQGQIVMSWLIPQVALKLAFWSDNGWGETVDIVPPEQANLLGAAPETLQMAVDPQDRVNFVFFEDNTLYYAAYDHQKVETQSLYSSYTGYGFPAASLLVDSIGSLAVLGIPNSPSFNAKLPAEGIPPTPTPTLTPSATQTLTLIPSVTQTLTPVASATPRPSPTPGISQTVTPGIKADQGLTNPTIYLAGLGGLLALLAISVVMIRGRKKS